MGAGGGEGGRGGAAHRAGWRGVGVEARCRSHVGGVRKGGCVVHMFISTRTKHVKQVSRGPIS